MFAEELRAKEKDARSANKGGNHLVLGGAAKAHRMNSLRAREEKAAKPESCGDTILGDEGKQPFEKDIAFLLK